MYARKSMLLAALLFAVLPAMATNTPKPPDPPTPTPTTVNNNDNDANAAAGAAAGAAAVSGSSSTAVGTGGAGGEGGAGGDAHSASISGSQAGVDRSGNSASLSGATGGTVGDTTSVAGGGSSDQSQAAIAGATNGDVTSNIDAAGGAVGDTTAGATADNSGGNSAVSVDASQHSAYSSQALGLPSIFVAQPAFAADGGITTERSACGPRVAKKTTTVNGVFFGLFKRGYVELGPDDELVDADEPYEYWDDKFGNRHIFGHQLLTVISKDSVAGSRSLGGNGGSTGGNWGGAGLSSNTSMTRTTMRVQIRRCELTPPAPEAPVIEFKEPRVPRG